MITINDIIKFAITHKVFTRKELVTNLSGRKQVSSPGAFSEQLNRLLKSGQLIRIKRGVYKLHDDARIDFKIICSKEIMQIYQQIKTSFPFVNFCIWPVSTLTPYMQHIPKLNLLLIDVERDAAESVFNIINTDSSKRVFLMPSYTDFERYIITNNAIIIRPLISESPLQLVEGIYTPTIEKILVDILGDIEFLFLQSSELNFVYTTIFERHKVNKNRLLRYATRRGRKNEVNLLFKINKL